jgi:hypothetical protein
VGRSIVTVTSSESPSANATFIATNGASLSGTVTIADVFPFAPTFDRNARYAKTSSPAPSHGGDRRASRNIVVGLKANGSSFLTAGAAGYRSLSVSRGVSTSVEAHLRSRLADVGLRDLKVSPAILTARIVVRDTSDIERTLRILAADSAVSWVQRDKVLSIRHPAVPPSIADHGRIRPALRTNGASNAASRLPNDGNYYLQSWSANMLDLPRAWSITTGSSSVTVAVVDMGVRTDHPSMGNLTRDGYDFVTPFVLDAPEPFCDGSGLLTSTSGDGDGPDSDPTDPDDIEFDDVNGCWSHNATGDHGLWTAGIIGAAGDQGIGLAGVNWNVRLRPIRVLDITGVGEYFDIAQGILYAAGLPAVGAGGELVQTTQAPIINLSFGGAATSPVLESAVRSAVTAGSLLVASAGNDGLDDMVPIYPASYDGVMAVTAVGMDGSIATYAHAGSRISVAAPGGDFRLDDNGGGGVLGPGWNFVTGKPNQIFGYGTSAAAPFVSGVAALMLAVTPSLSASDLRSRIEQYATRPANSSRSDTYGWGIVNAFNAIVRQRGPVLKTVVHLVDAKTGAVSATTIADTNGIYSFSRVPVGDYLIHAGQDENGDSLIGIPGRRWSWFGGMTNPIVMPINGQARTASFAIGLPVESEPNDDVAHANRLAVNSYAIGTITSPDQQDVFSVQIPKAGTYVFETSGVTGACGWGIEVDTYLSVTSATNALVGENDDFESATSSACSRIEASLPAGQYYLSVRAAAKDLATRGRYRLEVRSTP